MDPKFHIHKSEWTKTSESIKPIANQWVTVSSRFDSDGYPVCIAKITKSILRPETFMGHAFNYHAVSVILSQYPDKEEPWISLGKRNWYDGIYYVYNPVENLQPKTRFSLLK